VRSRRSSCSSISCLYSLSPQLSHHWVEHMTWLGAAETVVLLLPIFRVWSYTSWAAALIPADQPRTLWMMLLVRCIVTRSVPGRRNTSARESICPSFTRPAEYPKSL
jgi:hypothetical protein